MKGNGIERVERGRSMNLFKSTEKERDALLILQDYPKKKHYLLMALTHYYGV
jgi:hypothetical protein